MLVTTTACALALSVHATLAAALKEATFASEGTFLEEE